MNDGLFKKYTQQILSRATAKENIILTIKNKTNIDVSESEIILSKKAITLSVSSVKKAALLQKGIKDVLQEIGYTLRV